MNNPALQNQSFTEEAMEEHAKRIAKFQKWFDPAMSRVDEEINTYGIMILTDSSDPVCNIMQCLNPRIKTTSGVIVVNGVYKLVNYMLRHDIWKYWKNPKCSSPVPNIEPLDYVNDLLQRRGVADVVASGSRGSRITAKGSNQFAFGFGSNIVAYFTLVDANTSELEEAAAARNAVRVDFHGSIYYVKVPHALEAGYGVESFTALASGLVPLVHAYRTANDRSLADD